MKRHLFASVAGVVLLSASAGLAGTAIDHKVIAREGARPAPTALEPFAAKPVDGAFTQNVVTAGQRLFAEGNSMLKAVTVQPVGVAGARAWKLGSDEGGVDHEQTAPNPLSYLSAGIAANLYTSLEQAVEALGLGVDDMKVEVKVDFSWQDPFTPDWAGFTDRVTANFVIESDEAPDKLAELKALALKGWIAGQGLASAVAVDGSLAVNGTHFDALSGAPGLIPDPVSVDNGFTLSRKTGTPVLETIDPGEDVGIDGPMGSDMPSSIEFSVVALVESADDPEHPFLQRINVRAMQDNYSGWEIYADDSRGAESLDKAPSSLDYLVAGTSHCLMSQLSITPMVLKLDIPDFRAEHQFTFRQNAPGTADMEGFVDSILARVVVNSEEPMQALETYYGLSVRLCFAGEAWTGETPISSDLYINGNLAE